MGLSSGHRTTTDAGGYTYRLMHRYRTGYHHMREEPLC
jgi:hypothetical protein